MTIEFKRPSRYPAGFTCSTCGLDSADPTALHALEFAWADPYHQLLVDGGVFVWDQAKRVASAYTCPRCGTTGHRPGFWGTHTTGGMLAAWLVTALMFPVSLVWLTVWSLRVMLGKPGPLWWRVRCPSCRHKWAV
jgi:hypothetical protein